jgi:hypothetical protein
LDPYRKEDLVIEGTEKMKDEIARQRQIMNNVSALMCEAAQIGMKNTGNPEAPKTASFSEKIGKPFDITAKAELDKDFKKTANNPESQSEPFDAEVKVTDADMGSDKMPSGEKNNCEEYEDAKYVPDGSVANQKPTGGKVVKVNEATDFEGEDVIAEDDEIVGIEDENEGGENILSDDELDSMLNDDEEMDDEYVLDADELGFNDSEESDPRFAGMGVSDDEFMDSIDGEVYDDESEFTMESKASLKRIVEGVCDAMMKQRTKKVVKESFNDKLVRIIKEEMTNLNVWGQHPGYNKIPMTLPDNKEVIVNKGDRDWNDDSAKGSESFGKKIGSSAPFTDDVVKKITDVVVAAVKTTLKKK